MGWSYANAICEKGQEKRRQSHSIEKGSVGWAALKLRVAGRRPSRTSPVPCGNSARFAINMLVVPVVVVVVAASESGAEGIPAGVFGEGTVESPPEDGASTLGTSAERRFSASGPSFFESGSAPSITRSAHYHASNNMSMLNSATPLEKGRAHASSSKSSKLVLPKRDLASFLGDFPDHRALSDLLLPGTCMLCISKKLSDKSHTPALPVTCRYP